MTRRTLLPLAALLTLLLGGCSGANRNNSGGSTTATTSAAEEWVPVATTLETLFAKVEEWQLAPGDLERQRALAREAGLLTSAVDLQAPLSPDDENAALIYRLMHEERRAAGYPSPHNADLIALEGVWKLRSTDKMGVSAARAAMGRIDSLLSRAHQAAERPACVFERDWAEGPEMFFHEYSKIRQVALLLAYESIVLALEGKFDAAVANQSLGFRAGKHAESDGILRSHLLAQACDAITLRGMARILQIAGSDRQVARQVQDAIDAHPPQSDLRRGLSRETAVAATSLAYLRRTGPKGFEGLELLASQAPEDVRPTLPELGAEEEEALPKLVDAGEVGVLQVAMQAMEILQQPFREHRRRLRGLEEELASAAPSPTTLFYRLLLPRFEKIHLVEARGLARRRVVMAGAGVLAYQAEHGEFPDTLEPAMETPPVDPFKGKPLQYRREGEGFVVYSLGETGEFDGGQPGEKVEGRQTFFRYPWVATPK